MDQEFRPGLHFPICFSISNISNWNKFTNKLLYLRSYWYTTIMRQSFVDSSLESSFYLLFTINLFLIKMSNTSGDSLLSDSFLLRNFCRHLKTLETKKFPQNLFSRLGRLSVRLSFDTKYERPTLISHITKDFAKKRGQRKDIGIVLLWKYILYADLLSLLVLTVPFCATLPATTEKTWYWLLFEKINKSLRLIVNKLFCLLALKTLFRKTILLYLHQIML